MSGAGLSIAVDESVDARDRETVDELAAEAERVDGTYPLDDQVGLDLANDTVGAASHVLARDGDRLVGYAHVDLRAPDVASGHLVVRPDDRRRQVGRALLRAVAEKAHGRKARVWAHGDLDAARALAASEGWASVRELRKMRLPLATAIDDPSYPDDVSVRTFQPGADEDAWVALNAAAFRDHAEQGRLTVDDLRQREQQPWFDADGFFVAERDGEAVGFHWTKVHSHDDGTEVGEVYVVGVSPDQQGSGLGRALTLTGLRHLRDRGLDVILYVDGDNAAAVRVYERIGFEVASVDVMYEAR